MAKKKIRPKINNSFMLMCSPKTESLIGCDAGSSKELDDRRMAHEINRRKHKSEQGYKKARLSFASLNLEKARAYMKEALEYGAKAYWWSENTLFQDELHDYIHELAKWNHDNLGCFIEFENGKYVHRCMIAYSHKRMGISPGMYGDMFCSLCDLDFSICQHKTNRTYWVRGGEKNNEGECRICLKKKCSHVSKYLYRSGAIGRVKNAVLEEVSLVKYPVQPEVRLVSEFTYSVAEMMFRVGYGLTPGQRLRCHACRGTCPGFDELET